MTDSIRSALEECRDYFEQRADADINSDGTSSGNEEMKLLVLVEEALVRTAPHVRCVTVRNTPQSSDSAFVTRARFAQRSDSPVEANNPDDSQTVLSKRDFEAFIEALDSPPEPNEALRNLLCAPEPINEEYRSYGIKQPLGPVKRVASVLTAIRESGVDHTDTDLAVAALEASGHVERGAALLRQMDVNEGLADELARLQDEHTELAAALVEARECLVRHDVAEKWPYEQEVISRADAVLAKIEGRLASAEVEAETPDNGRSGE